MPVNKIIFKDCNNYKMDKVLTRYNDDLNKDKPTVIQILNKIVSILFGLETYVLDYHKNYDFFHQELTDSLKNVLTKLNNYKKSQASNYFNFDNENSSISLLGNIQKIMDPREDYTSIHNEIFTIICQLKKLQQNFNTNIQDKKCPNGLTKAVNFTLTEAINELKMFIDYDTIKRNMQNNTNSTCSTADVTLIK